MHRMSLRCARFPRFTDWRACHRVRIRPRGADPQPAEGEATIRTIDSRPGAGAGIGALADREFLHRSLELNARGLTYLSEGLADAGFTVVPSEANFVMVILPSEQEANRTFEGLLLQGVIVRPLKAFGLPQCLRVSTGTDEDTALCVEAFRRTHAASMGASRAS